MADRDPFCLLLTTMVVYLTDYVFLRFLSLTHIHQHSHILVLDMMMLGMNNNTEAIKIRTWLNVGICAVDDEQAKLVTVCKFEQNHHF